MLTQIVVEFRVAQMRVSAGIAPRIFKQLAVHREVGLREVIGLLPT